ncbi:MAG: thiol oxidoreductase [Myxococcales bacterium]|nr:thiol oxidoreductase [Myxococcales bacterium]
MARLRSLPLLLLATAACQPADEAPLAPYPGEELAGGETTVFDETGLAFALALRNLDHEQRGDHFVGNSFFNQNWVQAPASTEGRDGLGPVFNARSCSGCHFRDGRGTPPEPGEPMVSMLVRLSVPGQAPDGGPLPDPVYGDQLQPDGILDVPGEGLAEVRYEEVPGTYADGEAYSLRRPVYTLTALAFGPLAEGVLLSPRTAPAVIGLGLLEQIPAEDLLALEDPDDADDDGISGRANYPTDPVTGAPGLGRFGWKANQVGLLQQNTGAFLGDMGITTALHPAQNCTEGQAECGAALDGGMPEADALVVDRVTFYTRTLAVPARRDVDDPVVLAGRERFEQAGCAACHVPRFVTGPGESGIPQLEGQQIWPYTDLLLHDMGEALADGRPDYLADGREWRTPPLWGIGLVPTVNEHDHLLHDGRARGLAEAILWHGGEGEAAREAFRTMPREDREALLAFLESL